DYDTKENGTVTIRERDSMQQKRIPMDEVGAFVEKRCSSERD
ncbi:MAG TPA: His/Gly/Thr/Pro-type tRNA ligase C-terminal domain-containing protein, partial [Candidatus Hydrogenedentes bacterium]|nr:His/Gly/Thr/Pro-type tRNA ligase C-terminal domain-containing protein [Candidatus Hydrogenedentota bacterium]